MHCLDSSPEPSAELPMLSALHTLNTRVGFHLRLAHAPVAYKPPPGPPLSEAVSSYSAAALNGTTSGPNSFLPGNKVEMDS